MKEGILVFNLKAAFYIINNYQNIIRNKNYLIITDKITIYNLFKEHKKKVVCLDFLIKGKYRKKVFLNIIEVLKNFCIFMEKRVVR